MFISYFIFEMLNIFFVIFRFFLSLSLIKYAVDVMSKQVYLYSFPDRLNHHPVVGDLAKKTVGYIVVTKDIGITRTHSGDGIQTKDGDSMVVVVKYRKILTTRIYNNKYTMNGISFILQ